MTTYIAPCPSPKDKLIGIYKKNPLPKNTMKPVIKAANPSIHTPVPVREQMIQV